MLVLLFPFFLSAQTPANIYSFGAAGDGSTDDTAAVQSWISYCINNGVVCYAPRGAFKITDSITLFETTGVVITGDGYSKTLFLNRAGASEPTFLIDGSMRFRIANLAVVGHSSHPNDAIHIRTSNDGTPVPSAFGTIENVVLAPNGNGIHLDGTIRGNVGGINGFDLIKVRYWPSGYGHGATRSSGQAKHAILADGSGIVNAVRILGLDAVGVDTTITGHSCVKWATTGTSVQVMIEGDGEGDLEGVNLTAIDFTRVYSFGISDIYVELADLKFDACRYGTIRNVYNPDTITIRNSVNVIVQDVPADGTSTFDADNTNYMVGLRNSAFTNYTNNSVYPITEHVRSGTLGTGGAPGFVANQHGVPVQRFAGTTFANLSSSAANGSFAYCSDCTVAATCASGGTGAFAKRLNGVWVCN